MFYSYLKTFSRLGLNAIPMAADTGPIGGDLSHEFVILAETGESQIYADKNISDDLNQYDHGVNPFKKCAKIFQIFTLLQMINIARKSLKKLVKKNQMITKGIEVGHIFNTSDKYSK